MGFLTDRALLLRVLINMIKNAFEATAAGGTVRVWFELREAGPVFAVENSGVIPEEVRPHIFERSYSTKAAKGRGVGTYSMKLFGEHYLKGAVGYASEEGVTRFWICLPREAIAGEAAPASPATPSAPAAPRQAGGALRILFVEDDPALVRLGRLFLTRLGCEVTVCRDGIEADSVFRSAPGSFALVLTDGSLPGIDGAELARRVHQVRPEIPVVLCTGGPEISREACRESGFCGALQKPYSVTTLSEAIERALGGKPSV
jgi:two-component system, cell cycle sensor histidine kinase and response regulator CckA